MDFGTRQSLKREYLVEMAASIAFSAAAQDDRIGAIMFAEDIVEMVSPGKGRKHILSILSRMLSCPARPAKTDFTKVFQTLHRVFRRRATVFLFSDFYDLPPLRSLQVLSMQHQLIGVQLQDPLEREIPNIGFIPLEDPETGEMRWADTSSKSWRGQYAAQSQLYQQELKEIFSQTKAQLLSLTQQDDYAKKLVSYFKK